MRVTCGILGTFWLNTGLFLSVSKIEELFLHIKITVMPYFVGEPSPKEGQHHNSVKDLWDLKWKKKVQNSNSSPIYDTNIDDERPH